MGAGKDELGFDDYKTEDFLHEYEDGNSSRLQDIFEHANMTFLEKIKKFQDEIFEVDIYLEESKKETRVIPEPEPYIQHPDAEDNKTNTLVAEHRQMDIELDEISLLENPEVDIFPFTQRSSMVSTSTNKNIKPYTTTKKPREKKMEKKPNRI